MLGSMGVTGCFSFIQAQAHTRSSSSISSALIDNVKPVATKVANCSVTGSVFADANADGARGALEAPIAGRTVYLDLDSDGTFDPGEMTATTDADGNYQIETTFTSGTYPVRLVVPAGNICTTPVACAYNATFSSAGTNSVNNVFGLYVPATVSGTAYEDSNGNGTRDAGENTPIAGRTVFNDADNDGVLDPGESSTTTAADGTYTVGGLLPGTARIRFVNGGGWICNAPAPGCLHPVPVSGGQVITGRDFLAFQRTVGQRHGLRRRRRERRPRRRRERCGRGDRRPVRRRRHDAARHDHRPVPAAATASRWPTSRRSSPATTSSASRRRRASCARRRARRRSRSPPDRPRPSLDTGVYANATVSGTAYTDSNNNAARDGGEPPAPGVVIYADLDDDGVHDPTEPAATTDPAGNYTIAGLRPGPVHIRAQLPPTIACSTPAGCDHAIAPTSGATLTNRDFGLVQAASASGRVAIDDDADAHRRRRRAAARRLARVRRPRRQRASSTRASRSRSPRATAPTSSRTSRPAPARSASTRPRAGRAARPARAACRSPRAPTRRTSTSRSTSRPRSPGSSTRTPTATAPVRPATTASTAARSSSTSTTTASSTAASRPRRPPPAARTRSPASLRGPTASSRRVSRTGSAAIAARPTR